MQILNAILYLAAFDPIPVDPVPVDLPIGANVLQAGANLVGNAGIFAEVDPLAETETRYFQCFILNTDVTGTRVPGYVIDANGQLCLVYEVPAPA